MVGRSPELMIAIVEATLPELMEHRQKLMAIADGSPENERLTFYCQILIEYFRQNGAAIQTLIENHQELLRKNPDLALLATIRLSLRQPQLQKESLTPLEGVNTTEFSPLMQAELSFVQALVQHALKNYPQAEKHFLQASARYELGGALKKSLRSRFSALTSYSSIYPESRLFPEYANLHRKALEIQDYQTAGTALLNVSREFQRLQGMTLALDYASQAIAIYDEHNQGSREHGFALLHRAHLYFQLNRKVEAERDITYASTSPNAEVQSSCKILCDEHGLKLNVQDANKAVATWKERQNENVEVAPLGKLECQLLELLSQKPHGKHDLIEILYPGDIEYPFKEGRFKNLLARLRTRHPGLIVLENDLYQMVEKIL